MAGYVWRFDAPVELEIDARYQPFLTDDVTENCSIAFSLGNPQISSGSIVAESGNSKVIRNDGFYTAFRKCSGATDYSSCINYYDDTPLHSDGLIFPEYSSWFKSLDDLLDASNLENTLSALGLLNLHSSFINYNGTAILFTAPSGTGKSTQAQLWEDFAGAEQINGDRAVIRCVDGVWTAYGFPFAGSSGIYKNKSAPIRAIVVLRQAPENNLKILTEAEAFRFIYSELTVQRWNKAQLSADIDNLVKLVSEVPVYLFCCTPEQSAVELLKTTLFKENYL